MPPGRTFVAPLPRRARCLQRRVHCGKICLVFDAGSSFQPDEPRCTRESHVWPVIRGLWAGCVMVQ